VIDITSAIVNELKQIMPDAIIYRENPEQAIDGPAFFIYEVKSESQKELMAYESRRHDYCVMWFPDRKSTMSGIQEQCEQMRSQLLDKFQRLTDLALGLFNKETKIEEGTLHFTFALRYRVVPADETPKLTTFEHQGGVKGG